MQTDNRFLINSQVHTSRQLGSRKEIPGVVNANIRLRLIEYYVGGKLDAHRAVSLKRFLFFSDIISGVLVREYIAKFVVVGVLGELG